MWKPEDAGVRRWPNPFFLPKVLSAVAINQVIDLDAFRPEQGLAGDSRLLCPVRVLRAYIEKTAPVWRASKIFVCFGQAKLGLAASRQRLAHWLVDVIATS